MATEGGEKVKDWEIKYQRGCDIFVICITESDAASALCKFYLSHPDCDVISLKEVVT